MEEIKHTPLPDDEKLEIWRNQVALSDHALLHQLQEENKKLREGLLAELQQELTELEKRPSFFKDEFRRGYASCISDVRIILSTLNEEKKV